MGKTECNRERNNGTIMIYRQEHEHLPFEYNERYNNLKLIQWCKPIESGQWGYYASYKIGAEWIDEKEAIIITTKRKMENIDFLKMFMTCFSSNLELESFSKIYSIDYEKPAIKAPAFRSIVSLLIVVHFLNVVNRIKNLKRGYVYHCENLKKVKGHISLLKNERKNIIGKRFDRIYCDFSEYSIDIPENRLIKKALLFSKHLIYSCNLYSVMNQILNKNLALFENVSSDVEIKDVNQIKGHKLFNDYNEAVRLAKIILRHFDYNISKIDDIREMVPPFVIDMSLLYEHYVYGLLYEAYGNKIVYQYKGITGYPDFLYISEDFKAILDTKYIPKYEDEPLDTNVVRQLSGYSRDLFVLKKLGYKNIGEDSFIPSVPCVIVYPIEGNNIFNPFKKNKLIDVCNKRVKGLSHFYKIEIPLPIVI